MQSFEESHRGREDVKELIGLGTNEENFRKKACFETSQ
jgi:hypothetical protein